MIFVRTFKNQLLSKSRFSKKSMAGQAVLESVLLMSVVIAVWIGVAKVLRNQGTLQKVFGDPWGRLSSTIEFGIPISANQSLRQQHPTTRIRHSTRIADRSLP
jgi:hypothetical protein